MSSLKTGVIIAFGLTVLYGVYLVINKPEPSADAVAEAEATPDLAIGDLEEEEIEFLTGERDEEVAEDEEEDELGEEKPPVRVAARRGGRFSRDEEPLEEERTSRAAPLDDEEEEPAESLDDEADSEDPPVAPWRRNQEKKTPASYDEEDSPVEEPALEEEPEEEEPAPSTRELPPEEEETPLAESDDEASEDYADEPVADEPDETDSAKRGAPALTAANFDEAWTKMEQEIEAGKLTEALATISPFYRSSELSEEDEEQLLEVLDLLAWRVIFSKEHFLAKPHVVSAGESLEDIAKRYRVPPEAILKINGLKSAAALTAGMELKVVPGPFRAEVDPQRGELTLFLGDLYATRYAVETGNEPPPEPGEYTVRQRAPGASYRTRENRTIAAADPRNPYGGVFLDLGDGQCLHGAPEDEAGEELGAGCMRLRGKDAKEVYWLLSKGSKVTVFR